MPREVEEDMENEMERERCKRRGNARRGCGMREMQNRERRKRMQKEKWGMRIGKGEELLNDEEGN